jgi:GT2 family glycosyltransferase
MLHILTLTWNGCDKLTKLKESLIPSLKGIDYHWFIKDNASQDATVATASTWGDQITVIPYKDNRQNFSAGVNFLFKAADPADRDLIMLLNNDVIFNDTQSISKMLDIINKDPDVGVVGSRLLYTGTNKLQHAGVVFDPIYKTPMHFRAGQATDALAERNRQFQVVTGAVLITKAHYYRHIWTQNVSGIDGMDENYHWAFDDVDLCLSIKYNQGKKIIYCGETDIFHEESATLKKNPANKMFLPHNLQYLFGKWRTRYAIDKDIYIRDPHCNLYTAV